MTPEGPAHSAPNDEVDQLNPLSDREFGERLEFRACVP